MLLISGVTGAANGKDLELFAPESRIQARHRAVVLSETRKSDHWGLIVLIGKVYFCLTCWNFLCPGKHKVPGPYIEALAVYLHSTWGV